MYTLNKVSFICVLCTIFLILYSIPHIFRQIAAPFCLVSTTLHAHILLSLAFVISHPQTQMRLSCIHTGLTVFVLICYGVS